jgi:hypothetical protein
LDGGQVKPRPVAYVLGTLALVLLFVTMTKAAGTVNFRGAGGTQSCGSVLSPTNRIDFAELCDPSVRTARGGVVMFGIATVLAGLGRFLAHRAVHSGVDPAHAGIEAFDNLTHRPIESTGNWNWSTPGIMTEVLSPMARAIVRYSLNGSGPGPRTAITKVLEPLGFSKVGTQCWEAPDVDIAIAMGTMMHAMKTLAASGRLDHVWIYVDNCRRDSSESS